MKRVAFAAVAVLAACKQHEEPPVPPPPPPDPKAEATPPPAPPSVRATAPAPVALPGKPPGKLDGAHRWSKRFGSPESDAARGVAVGADGRVAVTGYFSGEVDFGAGPVSAAGDRDAFVAVFDRDGRLLWAKALGGPGEDIGQTVAIDSKGRVAVAGTFTDTVDFGSGKPFTSKGRTDLFIALYDASGRHVWSRRAGAEVEDRAYAVAFDRDDNLIATGYFGSAISLGGDPLVSAGRADAFAVKYAPDARHVWSWRIGGEGDDLGRAVAVAPDGSLWIAGDFQAEVVVGGKTLASRGNSDVLLAHVTADGAAIGAYSFGSYFHDFAVGVAVDAAGGPVVIGSFEQSIDFGGGELKGVKKKDMFLARFDANGAHLWSKAFGGRDDDVGGGVAVDAHGDVIATGWFWHGVDFGTGRLDSAGDSDIVVAKYAPNGEPIWARRFGDAGADFGRAVAVGPDGAAAVAGTFRGTVDFGGGPLTFAGERKGAKGDAFVAVFGP